MQDSQLQEFIKSQLQNGLNKDQIYTYLLSKGLEYPSIDQAFGSLEIPTQPPTPVNLPPAAPISNTETLSQLKNTQKPKKSIKKIAIISGVSILTLALIIGGGGFIYYNYFPSPEIVLFRAVQNAEKIKAVEFAADFTVDAKNTKAKEESANIIGNDTPGQSEIPAFNIGNINLNININGSIDSIDSNNIKSNIEIKADAKTDIEGYKSVSTTIQNKIIGNKGYAAIISGPQDIQTYTNQWLSYDLDELSKSSDTNPIVTSFKVSTSEKQKNSAADQKRLDAQSSKLFKITATLPSEKINDVDSYHYQYTTDPQEAKNYTILSKEISEKKSLTQSEKEEINKSTEGSTPVTGEIWIGKQDFNLYKLTTKYETNVTSQTAITFDSTLSFKNYNKPTSVEKPEKSYTFQELTDKFNPAPKLQSNDFSQPKIPSANTNIDGTPGNDSDGINCALKEKYNVDCDTSNAVDQDTDGLTNFQEFKLGTSPISFDTDKDGYGDGDEYNNNYNPLGEGKLTIKIKSICENNSCSVTGPIVN
jgi:hypothetical protein